MDTTIRTAIPTTDHTGIMVTVAPTIGTAATATTVTTEITTTIGGKELTVFRNPDRAGSRAISSQFLFSSRSDKKGRPAATSWAWATLPILSPDPWLADQSGTLFSVPELAPAVAVVARFLFAASTFAPPSGAPAYSAIQIERVPAGSGGDPNREAPHRSRA